MHLAVSHVQCRAHASVRICPVTGFTNKADSALVRGHPATQQHPGPDSLVSACQSQQQSLDERRRNDLGLTSSLLQLGPVSTGFPLPLWYSAGSEPDSDTKDDTARDRYLRRLRASPLSCILVDLACSTHCFVPAKSENTKALQSCCRCCNLPSRYWPHSSPESSRCLAPPWRRCRQLSCCRMLLTTRSCLDSSLRTRVALCSQCSEQLPTVQRCCAVPRSLPA